jgi:hypothetical protein
MPHTLNHGIDALVLGDIFETLEHQCGSPFSNVSTVGRFAK